MEIVLEAKLAVTPAGKPEEELIPVKFVVAWVMLVIASFMQTVGVAEAALTVLGEQPAVHRTPFQMTPSALNRGPTPNP